MNITITIDGVDYTVSNTNYRHWVFYDTMRNHIATVYSFGMEPNKDTARIALAAYFQGKDTGEEVGREMLQNELKLALGL